MGDELDFTHDYDDGEFVIDEAWTGEPAEDPSGPEALAVEDKPPAGYVSREEFDEVRSQFQGLTDALRAEYTQAQMAELSDQVYDALADPGSPDFLNTLGQIIDTQAEARLNDAFADMSGYMQEHQQHQEELAALNRIEAMLTEEGVTDVADRAELWELAKEMRPAVGAELGVPDGQQSPQAAEEAIRRAARIVAARQHRPVDELDFARGYDETMGYLPLQARPRLHASVRTKPKPAPKGPYAGMDEVAFARKYQAK